MTQRKHVREIAATGYVGDGAQALHDDGTWKIPGGGGGGTGIVETIVPGTGISVDSTDPANPVVSATGGGGGGGGWSTALDLPLTSLTGWGTVGGTWTADATGIHRTDASGTARRYYTAATFAQSACVIECDVRLDSGAGNAGITLRVPSDGASGGFRIDLRGDGTNVTQIGMEVDAIVGLGTRSLAAAIPYGTWITFRVAASGSWAAVFINGTLLTNVRLEESSSMAGGPRIGLVGFNAAASWRNFTLWTPALP